MGAWGFSYDDGANVKNITQTHKFTHQTSEYMKNI